MTERLDYAAIAPGAMKAMRGLEDYVRTTNIEESLVHLVKLRASQLNNCAYCVDKHSKDLLAMGESAERVFCVGVWRESPFYTERERGALAWTESLTLIAETHAPDEDYQYALERLGEKDLVDMTLLIALINGWNRFGCGFRDQAGTYQPKRIAVAEPTA